MNFNIEDFISPRDTTEKKDELQVPVDDFLYSPGKNKSNLDFKKETDELFEKISFGNLKILDGTQSYNQNY